MDAKQVAPYLVYLGGITAVVGGLFDVVYKVPLAQKLFNIALPAFFSGNNLLVLGILGILGGLLALYGGYKKEWRFALAGGVLGLLPPCALSVLAVIGAILLRK